MTHVLGCLLLWLIQLPAVGTPTAINFFSVQQDVEIGLQSSAEVEKTLPIVRDMSVNRYFRTLADRLVRNPSIPASLRYRFRIVNSRAINSQAFPGGPIYLTRGLLEIAGTEDELAALIAHEIGHVAARHGTSQLSRQLLVQAPISIAAGLTTSDGWKEQLQKLGIIFGVRASYLRYSREQELEAYLMAARILAAAHFDPRALETVYGKIDEVEHGEGVVFPTFFYNHPLPENHGAELDAEMERVGTVKRATVARPDFRLFLTALRRVHEPIVEAETPSPLPNDIVPNTYSHPQDWYRFCYPMGWQVVNRISPNGAIIAPVDGVQSSRAGDDITHGVIFDLFDLSDHPLGLEQATDRLIIYLRQRNQSLRVVPGAQSPTLVGDEPGLRTVMIGRSTSTDSSEVVWVVTRMYYQNLFYMVFVAPEEEFPDYQPIFDEMIRSAQLQ